MEGGRWGLRSGLLYNLLVTLMGGELKGLLTVHASVVVKLPRILCLSADLLTPRIARLRAPVAVSKEERSLARYSISRLCENGPCLL